MCKFIKNINIKNMLTKYRKHDVCNVGITAQIDYTEQINTSCGKSSHRIKVQAD